MERRTVMDLMARIAAGAELRHSEPLYNVPGIVLGYLGIGGVDHVIVDRLDSARSSSLAVRLRPDHMEREHPRPSISDLDPTRGLVRERIVRPGGVVVLDGLRAEGPGEASAHWITTVSHGPSEGHAVVAQARLSSLLQSTRHGKTYGRVTVLFSERVQRVSCPRDLQDALLLALDPMSLTGIFVGCRPIGIVRFSESDMTQAAGVEFRASREMNRAGQYITMPADHSLRVAQSCDAYATIEQALATLGSGQCADVLAGVELSVGLDMVKHIRRHSAGDYLISKEPADSGMRGFLPSVVGLRRSKNSAGAFATIVKPYQSAAGGLPLPRPARWSTLAASTHYESVASGLSGMADARRGDSAF